MLDTLFSNEISSERKKQIPEKEHQMQMTRQLQGGINRMCNISQGITEKAFSQGEKSMLLQLLQEGLISISVVAQKLNLTEEQVRELMK